MTRRGWIGLGAFGVLVYLVALVATFPAARALALGDPPQIRADGVSGSVWAGSAQRVAFGGPVPLDDLTWDLAAWRLLTGRIGGDADFHVAGAHVTGTFVASPGGHLAASGVTLKGPMASLVELAPVPILAAEGEMLAHVDEAIFDGRRPRRLQGQFQWENAALVAPVQVALGTVRGQVTPVDDGAHSFEIESSGGQVVIEGGIRLLADGRYRVDLRLTPARDAPPRIADTLGMVAQRAGNGAFVIRRSGQLTGF